VIFVANAEECEPQVCSGPAVMALVRAIIINDRSEVAKLIGASPLLTRERLAVGATRGAVPDFYFEEINHYLFAGDTPEGRTPALCG